MAFVGLLLMFGALGPLGQHRDSDGYYMSDPLPVDRPSHAIITGDIDILRGRYETLGEGSVVTALLADPDEVRMQGIAAGPTPLFMGIAEATAVGEYLGGVTHDEITSWDVNRAALENLEYTPRGGATAPPGTPGTGVPWEASVMGVGTLTLDWTIESGDWTAVVMNADASPGVKAELAFGAADSNINTIFWISMTLGPIALIGGGLLMYLGLRRPHRDPTSLSADLQDELSAQTETPKERAAPRS